MAAPTQQREGAPAKLNHRELITQNRGKFFELSFSDGESTVAKITSIDEANGEFVYEMSSTNQPTRYQNRLNAYSASFEDLAGAELLDKD